MKKYCFFMTGCESWFQSAKQLLEDGIAEPVFWLGDERHSKKAKSYFGDNVVHSMDSLVHNPHKLNDIDYRCENSEFFFSKNYNRIKDRTLKMMDRVDTYGMFNRNDREVIFQKIAIWSLTKLSKAKPEVLIMCDSPHSHAQYLIYEIAKFLKIPAYKFNTFMPLPLLFLENVETGEKIFSDRAFKKLYAYNFEDKLSAYVNKICESYSEEKKYEHKFMALQRQNSQINKKLIQFFNTGLRSFASDVKHNLLRKINKEYYHINPANLNFYTRSKLKKMKKKNLKLNCDIHKESYDINSKFIYFALMHEPERTTNPDGGDFHEQLLAILKIRDITPKDIDIYVKEHPSQFYLEERGAKGRSPLFYNLLKNIKGIKFIGPYEDSNKFIKNAIFSSSITGTVALESAIIGKPGLIFGRTWFEGSPNVIHWDDVNNFEDLIQIKIYPSTDIVNFLTNMYRDNCILGCQNLSAEVRFKDYLNTNFHSLEQKGISNLMKKCFEMN